MIGLVDVDGGKFPNKCAWCVVPIKEFEPRKGFKCKEYFL